ncbi:GlxA family transcriptional regulator [Pseudomonas bijieensis]|uniref:GlxA family transcriptional regulator n=1 Tax=Pseudomonas bijieensis TaxID=2681983 RepID=A0A6N1CPA2_9PSED|nr:GlxA family transcriptional regulator [Pseudomonas fluorescens]QKS85687.1 GlxA family transcriptional regulator [Pseudomonas bijieensis]
MRAARVRNIQKERNTVSTSQPPAPRSVGFLLLDDFTFISLASAIEPLRMANQLSGRELYRWFTLGKNAKPVRASAGLYITPDAKMEQASALNTVIVCGGMNVQDCVSHEHMRWLQHQADLGLQLGAICTGSWALGKAGLLDRHKCSVHWQCLAQMREAFPGADITSHLFSAGTNHLTSAGGTAPMDMMLHLIRREHGRELAAAICDMFMYERMRDDQDHQRIPLKHTLGANQPRLQAAIVLMEANLDVPLELNALAFKVGISRRQLERLFHKYLDISPSRYYLKLRLVRAQQLLKQTSSPVLKIGALCGFGSSAHFTRSYRGYFGVTPRDERASSNTYG